jgi:hypothetical protein
MSKTLVLFVYHIFNKRVKHFIQKSIFYDPNVDFVIISNNGYPPPFVPPYVKTLVRANIGYDFGGWSHALLLENASEGGKKLYQDYDQFIFVNSSVMGPFLTPGFAGKWTDIYLQGLQGNVKLFGSTINCCDAPQTTAHVQSYIFSMNKETLEYLISCEIFSTTNLARTFNDAVWSKEVPMSRKVIERGWNIGCLMPQYRGVDFTFQSRPVKSYTNKWVDVMNKESRNLAWNEYQLVFVKGNRLEINSTEDWKMLDKDPSNIVNRNMTMLRKTKDVMKLNMTDMAARLTSQRAKPMKLFAMVR